VLSLLAIPLSAQLTEATLKGVVTDAGGKLITGSPVEAKNENTGQTRSGVTDDRGAFVMPELPPGPYTVSVSAPGFKIFQQNDLQLKVGQTTELNVQLEVGGANEVVLVTADQANIAVASDARLSDTIAQDQLNDLPVAQRDITGLTRLSAGATAIPGNASSTKLSNSPVVTVNGNRYRGNNFVLDGSMDTNPNNTGEPAIVPTLESVEEVQVQTGNFSAEFGRGNGSVVNLRTKSGTNQFHGKAWEYIRNAAANGRATTLRPAGRLSPSISSVESRRKGQAQRALDFRKRVRQRRIQFAGRHAGRSGSWLSRPFQWLLRRRQPWPCARFQQGCQ
jgi:hypothetical protein